MKKRPAFCLIALLLAAAALHAQVIDYAAAKEKIYVHTSHVFFKPGETMYFKIYAVSAKDQTPTRVSNTVYAEVLNPAGGVVQKLSHRLENGYAEGSFDFGEAAVGGVYKLRAYTTWMRNESDSTFFTKEITVQKTVAPRVLLKLDFPEKGYGPGSEVTARFEMRNLGDQPVRNYRSAFTVSLGGKTAQTGYFTTDHEGKAAVKFVLPKDLSTTDGLLAITVNYDAFTEAISRSIPIVLNKLDLQFLPEGGTLVHGLVTNVAFKAVNEAGKAADVKGAVWDDRGNQVAFFESYHFGTGKFAFTPERGRTYTARLSSPAGIAQTYTLPAAADNGVVMNLRKEAATVRVTLRSTDDREVKLVGRTKGVAHFTKTLSLKKGENVVAVSEALFPVGIAQFTLADAGGLPLAERLCFLNEEKHLRVTVATDKQRYGPREKVTLTLKTLDETGKPVPSNFSLAVVDDKLWTMADDRQDHLLSWLLLGSELKGKIEEPQFYFKKDEPKAAAALDLLLLTHGYRYFDYIPYVQAEGKLKFTPDGDNVLSGVVATATGRPVKATVFLANPTDGGKVLKTETGDDGAFFFSGIAPAATYYLFAQSANRKEKVTINVLQQGIGYNPAGGVAVQKALRPDAPALARPVVLPAAKDQTALAAVQPFLKKEAIDDRRAANLNEVVVVGYGAQRRRAVTGAVAVVEERELLANNLPAALEGRVAGVQVMQDAVAGAPPAVRIRGVGGLRGTNKPMLVVDGVVADAVNLGTLAPADVESVTVLKDATAAALYGARAANGVIVIESKKFRSGGLRFNLPNKTYYASQAVYFSGNVYAVAKRFYAPRYASTNAEERTDYRETIYWNPVVQTDEKGEATVSFYNSDASTTFRVVAEGIGYNGRLGRTEKTYAVKNALSVDAKIPPYLTAGDKALLPLVIKNNKTEPLTLSVSVVLPAGARTGDFPTTVTVLPDSSREVLIPLEVTAALKGSIQFFVEGSGVREKIALPVEAVEKGFPVIQTFAGNESGQHRFTVSTVVPGSLKAGVKLFRNVEGQLLDGIESMLREPYGCFEQTSSATYPNIYVLKYLRESGRSNPETERKALDLIEKGYKRLVGYETAQNGFEWFGKTPPHEALTAYGLLEFTDMQEFFAVDKAMLERTKKFLLSRRDGEGGFKLATGGLDQFASVPAKIANSYIVYALTEAGLGKEIQREYEAAVKKALESADGYRLSMMALAASNLKDAMNYRLLLSAANDLYAKNDLAAETSVVNSREASLRVETRALYALALMRDTRPNTGVVAGVISKILGEKCYYGYGSTQATVLALKAIVEYAKLAGRTAEEGSVDLLVNNRAVNEGADAAPMVAEGANLFAVRYANAQKAVPYSLEVSYHTLTPPASDKAELRLQTHLASAQAKRGQTVRLQVDVTNTRATLQAMAVAKIGIPAGLTLQPWQLKELMEKNAVAYYEIFDHYLVFYWMGFRPGETKRVALDLKADVAGTYRAKASTAYLYYMPEYKHWNEGVAVEVRE